MKWNLRNQLWASLWRGPHRTRVGSKPRNRACSELCVGTYMLAYTSESVLTYVTVYVPVYVSVYARTYFPGYARNVLTMSEREI